MKKTVTLAIIISAILGMIALYCCTGQRKMGENTYKFENINLSKIGKKYINYNNSSPDSVAILYTDSVGRAKIKEETMEGFRRFELIIPSEKQDHWENKINLEDEVSFRAKKTGKHSFEIYKETIKIKK